MNDLFVATSPALLVLFLNAAGAVFKHTPLLANAWIPLLLPLIGAVVYPAISDWTAQNAVIGFVAGAGSVGLHNVARDLTTNPVKTGELAGHNAHEQQI